MRKPALCHVGTTKAQITDSSSASRLINVFVVHCLDSIISILTKSKQFSEAEQAGLSLTKSFANPR